MLIFVDFETDGLDGEIIEAYATTLYGNYE